MIAERIVISGLSGRFPDSDSVDEFSAQLFAGKDLISDDHGRYDQDKHGLPRRGGRLKSIDRFDAAFFDVPPKLAQALDPITRILMEVTYEAISDAGIDPQKLRGSNTGVFLGQIASETMVRNMATCETVNNYTMLGMLSTMQANRLSYAFDLRGPSVTLDTACSASLTALSMAVASMRSGECDSAIVCGAELTLTPAFALQFGSLGMLSPDGSCKSFDKDANGYVRSEAAVAIYLQHGGPAKRIYATILNIRTNCDGDSSTGGITTPSSVAHAQLLRQVYEEAGVNPHNVSYVELHATGTPVGDPAETAAIVEVFCSSQRPKPLLIGSVKSNMGHSEGASGLCAVAKTLISIQADKIPPNIHFHQPNPNIPGLFDGRLKVVTEATRLDGRLLAINSFGVGGSNVHMLLEAPPAPEHLIMGGQLLTNSSRLRLVCGGGRTEESAEMLLGGANAHCTKEGFLSLIDAVANREITKLPFRGYTILNADSPERAPINIEEGSTSRPQICYVYNGMGSQWAGMGHALMQVRPFRRSLMACSDVVKPLGIDLEGMILSQSADLLANSTMSAVATTAIQVAMTDTLHEMGIEPDYIIGHSLGEISCSYADGCLDLEQTMLLAYGRGTCTSRFVEQNIGAMAAVGLTWEHALAYCEQFDVEAVCHNALDSVTVAGEKTKVEAMVAHLQESGIFARAVFSSGYAFHSKLVRPAAPHLYETGRQIMTSPKLRSQKWISTCFPQEQWQSDDAKYCSAEYHLTNYTSPVRLYDALKSIPPGTVTIEIGPNSLLQAILKRVLHQDCLKIGLASGKVVDNLNLFLECLGRMYQAGVDMNLQALYPANTGPVASDTPSLSPWLQWDHTDSWTTIQPTMDSESGNGATAQFTIDPFDVKADEFLLDHKIDGRALFPFTGYLVFVWKAFCELHNLNEFEARVCIEDIVVHSATILDSKTTFAIHIGSAPLGRFEVTTVPESATGVIASGRIRPLEAVTTKQAPTGATHTTSSTIPLTTNEVYRGLFLRGYEYGPQFRTLDKLMPTSGVLNWNNWIAFLDGILQAKIACENGDQTLKLPTRIRRVKLAPLKCNCQTTGIDFHLQPELDIITADTIEFSGIETRSVRRQKRHNLEDLLVERGLFVAHFDVDCLAEFPHIADELRHAQTATSDVSAPAERDCIALELNERTLRPMFTIITENSPNQEIAACAVGLENTELIKKMIDIQRLQPMVDPEWTILLPSNGEVQSNLAELESRTIKITTAEDLEKSRNGHSLEMFDFVLLHNVLEGQSDLSQYFSTINRYLRPQGFIVVVQVVKPLDEAQTPPSTNEWTTTLSGIAGFQLISVLADPAMLASLYLLRETGSQSPAVIKEVDISNCADFSWVRQIQTELQNQQNDKQKRVWLTSKNSSSLGALGLVKTLKREKISKDMVNCMYEVGANGKARKSGIRDLCAVEQVLSANLLVNCFSDGKWGHVQNFRVMPGDLNLVAETRQAYVNCIAPGDLSSLEWVQDVSIESSSACTVYCTALNFRDVMLATGSLASDAIPCQGNNPDSLLGMEFAGRLNQTGQRVMGMMPGKAMATEVDAGHAIYWPVPEGWTMKEASSVPVAYGTAYYALVVRGGLRSGQSVLIHSGAGGVGQAAIAIALSFDCQVFTTVGSSEKVSYLLGRFPGLLKQNIGDSRSLSFEALIMQATHGKGVDLVLNSLAGEKLKASLRCVATNGRFLELGKVDLFGNTDLGMNLFLKNISFSGILLEYLMDSEGYDRKMVRDLVQAGLDSGTVKPLDITTFQSNQVEEAFRYMTRGQHIGKIVIQLRGEETNEMEVKLPLIPRAISAKHQLLCNPDHVYLITGGLGGLALELAQWLVKRGAKKLVLSSRRGVVNGYQQLVIRACESNGVFVKVSTLNVALEKETDDLITLCQKIAPLGGVFHTAMVLNDAPFISLTAEAFQKVAAPKLWGARNLDNSTRRLCGPELKWFLGFSSIAAWHGLQGSATYSWANAAMERIVEKRRLDGFCGSVIQFGGIEEVGILTKLNEQHGGPSSGHEAGADIPRVGARLQSLESVFQLIELSLVNDHPVLCGYMQQKSEDTQCQRNTTESATEKATSLVARIFGIKANKLDESKPFGELRLDSLMAVEMRESLERNLGITVPVDKLYEMTTADVHRAVEAN